MGRKPNPLILEFFERGAKLNDNSNRYQHRCKACGEDFPKGRIDSLTNHLTKKCPAISEADRINACLALHGINGGPTRARFDGLLHTGPNPGPPGPELQQPPDQDWTPLQALAEASRRVEADEKRDDHLPLTRDPTTESIQTTLAAAVPATVSSSDPFELHEQFTLENPPMSLDNRQQRENKGVDTQQKLSDILQNEDLSAEERLRRVLEHETSLSESALSVAVAATARLNPSLLDPQLLADEAAAKPIPHHQSADMMIEYPPSPEKHQASANPNQHVTPWDGMTYIPEGIHAPATVNDHGQHLAGTLSRGGFRMDTSNGAHHRHSRARFEPYRRKEVQDVRRIGACIRCRILRKTCSADTPCGACQKVLSPRVWHTGCIRTKLSEHIDLYSAGVQVVMAQKRINRYKDTHVLGNVGVVVEASHFPETGHKVTFQVLQGTLKERDGSLPGNNDHGPVVLLDSNNEDIPSKVENYMRQALPELIRSEPSHHIRVTLEVAVMVANETNDELLKRSLELWGIVEMMDRERQWTMLVKSPKDGVEDHWIKDDSDSEAYTNICMQLTAAAERKASAASKNLLNGMQRNLQDGKTKLGFPMFLTVMLFLNCMEKTTWAFKAWDEENLRPKWPLEKPPSHFTNKGEALTELLRLLLVIRRILPGTTGEGEEAPIRANGNDPIIQSYFEHLNVTPAYLRTRHAQNNFQPTDSRSLEFLFCAPLLLHCAHPLSDLQ
ncbi:hypothetical protein F4677DRAFT_214783 [Hypoxylon crocopeplum]|nr:hypothetical protein F4677DRAFT_214783 [Hypoxylon crocopeplum]